MLGTINDPLMVIVATVVSALMFNVTTSPDEITALVAFDGKPPHQLAASFQSPVDGPIYVPFAYIVITCALVLAAEQVPLDTKALKYFVCVKFPVDKELAVAPLIVP